MTTNGGVYAIESEDGQFLYYAKFAECGVWKRSLKTGEESRLPINVCNWLEWALLAGESHFLNLNYLPNGN